MGYSNIKLYIPLDIQRFSGTLTLSEVYETSVDIANNLSYVHAKLTLSVGSNTYNQTGSAYYYVNMSGQNNSYGTGNQYISVPKGYSGTLWEGTLGPFYHNSDGSLGNVAISAYAYVVSNTQPTAYAECGMNTIPRAPSYNSASASSITETSVRLTASIDTKSLSITGGGWDLSTDGGSTWTYYDGNVTDKTITGLTAGQRYWYRGYCITSAGNNHSNWQEFTTYPYPSLITPAANFTIGNTLTLNFNNPLGRALSITGIGADNSTIFTGTTSGTSLTGFNDTTSVNNQYASIPNNTSGTYKVRLVVSSLNRDTTVTAGTYSVNSMECSPIFNLYTFEDIDQTTLALTGNNQYLVIGYSNIKATVTTANKATARKSATMKNYIFSIGDKTSQANYKDNDDVYVGISDAKKPAFTLYAKDSRNLTTPVALAPEKTIYYEEPKKNLLTSFVKRVNNNLQEEGNSEKVLLTLNGSIWYNSSGDIGDFGQVRNSIKSAYYKYAVAGTSSWSNNINITPTLNNDGTFEFNSLIQGDTSTGFDIANVYDIEVTINDELSSVVYQLTLAGGIPHIAYARNGVGIMGGYDENEGGLLQVGGKRVSTLEKYQNAETIVGEWTDGKPIYRQVIETDLTGASNKAKVLANISNVDTITELKGIYYQLSGSIKQYQYKIGMTNTTHDVIPTQTSLHAQYNSSVQKTYIIFAWEDLSSVSTYRVKAIIEYTKTTD